MKQDHKEALGILNYSYDEANTHGALNENELADLEWSINVIRLAFEQLDSQDQAVKIVQNEFSGSVVRTFGDS